MIPVLPINIFLFTFLIYLILNHNEHLDLSIFIFFENRKMHYIHLAIGMKYKVSPFKVKHTLADGKCRTKTKISFFLPFLEKLENEWEEYVKTNDCTTVDVLLVPKFCLLIPLLISGFQNRNFSIVFFYSTILCIKNWHVKKNFQLSHKMKKHAELKILAMIYGINNKSIN